MENNNDDKKKKKKKKEKKTTLKQHRDYNKYVNRVMMEGGVPISKDKWMKAHKQP